MTITRMVPATLAGQTTEVTCDLSWNPKVPVAVTATFTTSEGSVEWVFALELLRMGAVSVFPSLMGRGDVKVSTDGNGVVILVNSPEGTATVSLDYAATREFLDAVCLANVREAEAMDALVDAFLVTLNEEAF